MRPLFLIPDSCLLIPDSFLSPTSSFGLYKARKSAGLEEIEKAIEEGATG